MPTFRIGERVREATGVGRTGTIIALGGGARERWGVEMDDAIDTEWFDRNELRLCTNPEIVVVAASEEELDVQRVRNIFVGIGRDDQGRYGFALRLVTSKGDVVTYQVDEEAFARLVPQIETAVEDVTRMRSQQDFPQTGEHGPEEGPTP